MQLTIINLPVTGTKRPAIAVSHTFRPAGFSPLARANSALLLRLAGFELRERVRVHSQAAADALKRGAAKNDLFDRIAGDPLFGIDAQTIARMADPAAYTGLARQQTERFLIEEIDPVLEREREHISAEAGEVRV